MALKWILWDDDDLASFIRREIHSKNTIEKIIIDIEREINVPSAIPFDEIRKLIGDMLTERRIMTENSFVSKQTPQPSISEAEIKKCAKTLCLACGRNFMKASASIRSNLATNGKTDSKLSRKNFKTRREMFQLLRQMSMDRLSQMP